MCSAANRAKRVAPALETRNRALKRRKLGGGRPFSSLKAPTSDPRTSQLDNPREGRESALLSDEDKLEDEVERILSACENIDGGLGKRLFQKAFFSSKTCGLCYGHSSSSCDDSRLAHTEGVKGNQHTFENREELGHKPAAEGRADPVCTKAACVRGLCEHPVLALRVFYNASEEDLMNTIEREFS